LVTLDGRPLVFAALQASAHLPGGYPIAIAWTQGANATLTARLIRPASEWMHRPWDDRLEVRQGLSRDALLQHATPAPAVAVEASAAFDSSVVVTALPGFERIWLAELYTQAPIPGYPDVVGAGDLALLMAQHLGIPDAEFASIAATLFFRLYRPGPAGVTARACAALVQALLDYAGRERLIDPAVGLALERHPSQRRHRHGP
jgi:hypothetical protein